MGLPGLPGARGPRGCGDLGLKSGWSKTSLLATKQQTWGGWGDTEQHSLGQGRLGPESLAPWGYLGYTGPFGRPDALNYQCQWLNYQNQWLNYQNQ